jgi:hypothetical protein
MTERQLEQSFLVRVVALFVALQMALFTYSFVRGQDKGGITIAISTTRDDRDHQRVRCPQSPEVVGYSDSHQIGLSERGKL